MTIQEMIARQQAIVSGARAAGRDLTAEERAEFDGLQRQIDAAGNNHAQGAEGQGGEDPTNGAHGMGNDNGQQGTDPVTDLPGAAGTDLDHHPRALQAENIAGARWWRVMPGPLQQVGTVEAGGGNANADPPHIAGRNRPLRPLQLPLDALQCLHAASIVSETPAIDSMRLCAYRRVFAFCRPAPTEPAPYQTA